MKIVTVTQMQQIEKSADAKGLSYEQMMYNAGEGIGLWVHRHYPSSIPIIGLIGSGNNGGDTLIALTMLAKLGYPTFGFLVKKRPEAEPLLEDYLKMGGALADLSGGENLDVINSAISSRALLLDGVLGTGLKLPLRGILKDVMGKISHEVRNCSEIVKIAIDCPSGVDCDTGAVADATISADHTLYMGAMKMGLLKHPARDYVGDFHFIDIGIDRIADHLQVTLPDLVTVDQVKEAIPLRPSEGHKGTFGTVYVVAGSNRFIGAAYLTGLAAYRSGCGLVHLAALPDVHHALAGRLIEGVWTLLPERNHYFDPAGIEKIKDDLKKVEVIVIGPGWGLGKENVAFLSALLDLLPRDLPAIFDADGLKLLKKIPQWWQKIPSKSVLTPHPGEMSILTDLSVDDIQSDRWTAAGDFARKWGHVVLLKGAMTVVSEPDGSLHLLPFSDASLATAGSGDILSGIIAGLMSQGMAPAQASYCGAWIHALAGKAACEVLGFSGSVTAGDILSAIPRGFSQL
jgi:NAD(P)H-hydrate epimerase